MQHDRDHLMGVLSPTRVADFSRFGYMEVLCPGVDPSVMIDEWLYRWYDLFARTGVLPPYAS